MSQQEDQPAVVIKHISKEFKIPLEKSSGLKQHIVNFFQRKKGYREFKALNDVSFDIKKGEFFGIVGKNGSGKSTLLKTLSGIYAPDEGLVQVNGSLATFIELGVGFNPELSGRENVFLNGALLGFSREEMEGMYEEIVDFAELGDFMEERLKNYSSGMQVRLAFSVAIRARSDILVLDEVLAVGDSNFQKKCNDYFRQLKADEKTVILVSHNMEAVKKFGDRALLMEDGKIVKEGDPEEVSDEYIRRNMELRAQQPKKETRKQQTVKGSAVEIKNVRLLDAHGKEIKDLATRDGARVAVEYEVKEKVEEINIGIGVRSESNAQVFGYNTQMDKFELPKQSGELVLAFDSLPLLQGSYQLNVNCFGTERNDPYDTRMGALTFFVSSFGKEQLYNGILSIPHEWKL